LFLDFKKAFDSVEWSFILKALETFGFGSPLIQWIRTFYQNIQSCVVNNGHATPFFELERGVRQGCPLSAILFVVEVEFLADSIRNDQSIEGIIIKGKEHKISQYADDTSCFVSGLNSVQTLFSKLEVFKGVQGRNLPNPKQRQCGLEKTDRNLLILLT